MRTATPRLSKTNPGPARSAAHLEVLAGAGLVRGSRRGRERIWEIEPKRLAEARAYLDRISAQWDVALARLKLFVEGPDERH